MPGDALDVGLSPVRSAHDATGSDAERLRARSRGVPSPADVLGGFLGPIGVYVHIPFCQRICPSCPYNKVLAATAPVVRYFAALSREIGSYRAVLERPVASLYIGGGTPSLFPAQVAEIIGQIPAVGERAVEVHPAHATPERLHRLAEAGINFVSIGAQSFDDGVLRHLGRPHTAADNRTALHHARGRFDCVDVDLIFDTAYADRGTFLRDVRYCFEQQVDQVSSYPLMRFGYTPFGKAAHDRRAEHRLLREAEHLAAEHGYERRSVWTFNRLGSPTYTSITREFVLGLGAGSATYSGTELWVNHFGIECYLGRVASGELPIARRIDLGKLGGAVYYLFWQAYAGRVDLGRLRSLFGASGSILARAVGVLAAASPLAIRKNRRVVLTPRGLDVYHDLERLVTYHLIEPLWADLMLEHGGEERARGAEWIQTGRAHGSTVWRALERLLRTQRYGPIGVTDTR